jgi:protein phosphatase
MPVRRPAAEPIAPQRKPLSRRLIAFGAVGLAILVIAGLLIVRSAMRSNYYVAVQDPMVYIMRGVPGSFLGITLADPFQVACLNRRGEFTLVVVADHPRDDCRPLKVDDLNAPGQLQVRSGLPQTGSLDEARQSLDRLVTSSLLPICASAPPPTPTATTLPSPTPGRGMDCRVAA